MVSSTARAARAVSSSPGASGRVAHEVSEIGGRACGLEIGVWSARVEAKAHLPRRMNCIVQPAAQCRLDHFGVLTSEWGVGWHGQQHGH